MTSKAKVLCTNDDGIHSEGLHAIVAELIKRGFDVRVFAPADQKSGISHSLSMWHDLIVEEYKLPAPIESVPAWKVHGTPADCTKLAVTSILGHTWKPDIVVSGINDGLNIGYGYLYSGTMAGAREGVVLGLKGVAVSVDNQTKPVHWDSAAVVAANVVETVAENKHHPGYVLSVNIPNVPIESIQSVMWTKQGNTWFDEEYVFIDTIEPETAGGPPRQKFRFQGKFAMRDTDRNTDYIPVTENHVTITAMHLHYASHDKQVSDMHSWSIPVNRRK